MRGIFARNLPLTYTSGVLLLFGFVVSIAIYYIPEKNYDSRSVYVFSTSLIVFLWWSSRKLSVLFPEMKINIDNSRLCSALFLVNFALTWSLIAKLYSWIPLTEPIKLGLSIVAALIATGVFFVMGDESSKDYSE